MLLRNVDLNLMEDMGAAPLHFLLLYRDHSVALFRAGHALAARSAVSEDDQAAWRMLSFHPGSDWIERKRGSKMLSNSKLDPVAFVSQIALLPFLLLSQDSYDVVSHRMAQQLVDQLLIAAKRHHRRNPAPLHIVLLACLSSGAAIERPNPFYHLTSHTPQWLSRP